MDFGSDDDSDRQDRDVETDDDNAVSVHENDYEGQVEFDTDASTTALVDKLEASQVLERRPDPRLFTWSNYTTCKLAIDAQLVG